MNNQIKPTETIFIPMEDDGFTADYYDMLDEMYA